MVRGTSQCQTQRKDLAARPITPYGDNPTRNTYNDGGAYQTWDSAQPPGASYPRADQPGGKPAVDALYLRQIRATDLGHAVSGSTATIRRLGLFHVIEKEAWQLVGSRERWL
jgi:hypothetical protein